MSNRSLSAPSVAAGRAEPTPDRPSLALYTDGLEGNLGGPAASEAPTAVDSLILIVFGGGGGGIGQCVFIVCFLSSSAARDSLVVVTSFGFSGY